MNPLEIALLVLVVIWTIIFALIAVGMLLLLRGVKKSLDRIDRILAQGENMADGLGAMGKVAATGLGGLLLKAAGQKVASVVAKKRSSKKK